MHLTPLLLLLFTILFGLVGLVFLLFPDRIARLEERLNAPWGDREVTALRLGLSVEQDIERVINRSVLDQRVTWDGWARNHPRMVGAVLCLIAAVLWWQL